MKLPAPRLESSVSIEAVLRITAQNVYLQAVALDLRTVAIGAFDAGVKRVAHRSEHEQPLCLLLLEGNNHRGPLDKASNRNTDSTEGKHRQMYGWQVPPPRAPTKSREELRREREQKVQRLLAQGLLRSERIKVAMLKVAREDFLPRLYRDYAYWEVPLPLPGEMATISCPHSYPLFYEPLGLAEGQKFVEIGLGSGYGAALAREIVGQTGLVVSMDIDPVTFAFARRNLERAGYRDIILVRGDGGLGHPELAPYDRICLTAGCTQIPSPLLEQLKSGGRLIAPVVEHGCQNLTLVEKRADGISTEVLCEVLYVSLRGKYGIKNE